MVSVNSFDILFYSLLNVRHHFRLEDVAIDKIRKNAAFKEFIFCLGKKSYVFLKCYHLIYDKELNGVFIASILNS